jgi:O-antigen ligase
MTGSRAGIVVGMAAVVAVLSLVRGRILLPVIALAVSLPVAVVALLARSDTSLDSNAARTHAWGDALAAIAERPLAGFGAGTYPTVSILHRGPELSAGMTWDSSHSLYLDSAATLGIPVTVAIVCVLFWLAWRLLRAPSAVSKAGAVAILAVMAHAMVDFSPSTPAVYVTVAVLVGVGISTASSARAAAVARRDVPST